MVKTREIITHALLRVWHRKQKLPELETRSGDSGDGMVDDGS